jgi:hypothetical protein
MQPVSRSLTSQKGHKFASHTASCILHLTMHMRMMHEPKPKQVQQQRSLHASVKVKMMTTKAMAPVA